MRRYLTGWEINRAAEGGVAKRQGRRIARARYGNERKDHKKMDF